MQKKSVASDKPSVGTKVPEEEYEKLWTKLTTGKKPETGTKGDRTPDANYVSGWRDDTSTWSSKHGDVEVRAIKVDWKTFNPSVDENGRRRSIEVWKGEDLLYRAGKDDGSRARKFVGPDERHAGDEEKKATDWYVERGEMLDVLKKMIA